METQQQQQIQKETRAMHMQSQEVGLWVQMWRAMVLEAVRKPALPKKPRSSQSKKLPDNDVK